jgi:Fe-S cluster biosynthesis and repair protein YggX
MASRKHLLRNSIKAKTLACAEEQEHWKAFDFAKVLCTDENKLELSNSKRRKKVRRKIREPLRKYNTNQQLSMVVDQ